MSPRTAEPPVFEYVLLGLIRKHSTHGYELFHSLHRDQGIGMIWQVKPARLYAVLDRLDANGWLEAELQTGEGFIPRKCCSISAAGEQAFQTWLATPVSSPHRMRQEFLARLYFSLQENRQTGLQLVQRQLETCRSWQLKMHQDLEKLPAGQVFEQEVLRFRTGQVQAMQNWLEQLSETFQVFLGTENGENERKQ